MPEIEPQPSAGEDPFVPSRATTADRSTANPSTQSVVLRVEGEGGIWAADIGQFLGTLDHAYNSILILDEFLEEFRLVGPTPSQRRMFGLLGASAVPDWYFIDPPDIAPSDISMRLRNIVRTPMPGDISSLVAYEDRLVLKSVRLESPGFWNFLGKLNPLEVLRQYIKDRHEMQKDKTYRNAAEADRLRLNNELLENRVIKERIQIAKSLGARKAELNLLLITYLYHPLQALDQYQDRAIIGEATLEDPDKEYSPSQSGGIPDPA